MVVEDPADDGVCSMCYEGVPHHCKNAQDEAGDPQLGNTPHPSSSASQTKNAWLAGARRLFDTLSDRWVTGFDNKLISLPEPETGARGPLMKAPSRGAAEATDAVPPKINHGISPIIRNLEEPEPRRDNKSSADMKKTADPESLHDDCYMPAVPTLPIPSICSRVVNQHDM